VKNTHTHRRLVLLTMVAGAFIRLANLPFAGWDGPTGFGALYREFAHQIAAAGFRVPERIPFFTDGGIPFGYPPLPFAVEAALIDLFRLPEFFVVNLMPPLLAVMTLPLFHLVTGRLGLNERTRLMALVMYALTPGAFIQLIEAGGLSESAGSVALLILAVAWTRTLEKPTVGRHVVAGAAWALCILAAPGSAYLSVALFVVFMAAPLLLDPPRPWWRALALRCLVGLVALLLSAPYWFPVVRYHGFGLFLDMTVRGQGVGGFASSVADVVYTLGFVPDASGGFFPTLVTALVVAGAFRAITGRLWAPWIVLVLASIVPREADWLVVLPGSVLAGLALSEMVGPRVRGLLEEGRSRSERVAAVVVVFALSFNIAGNLYLALENEVWWRPSVPRGAMEAMHWVRESTPTDSRLVVVDTNPVLEWTAQVTRRTVLNVPYGAEWRPDIQPTILGLWSVWPKIEDARTLWRTAAVAFGGNRFVVLTTIENARALAPQPRQGRVNIAVPYAKEGWAVMILSGPSGGVVGVKCPHCDHRVDRFPVALLGEAARCGRCNRLFTPTTGTRP